VQRQHSSGQFQVRTTISNSLSPRHVHITNKQNSENADQPRFASLTSDISLAQNVLAYTLLADGVPIVYYGQEQRFNGASDPTNREALWLGEGGFDTTSPLYKLVSQLNQIRNQAIFNNDEYLTYNNWAIYSDTSTIAMRKGATGYQIITVLSNLGANGASYSLSLLSTDTGFTANEALVEVLSCSQVTADGSGNLAVAMGQGLPKVCSRWLRLQTIFY